MHLRRLSTWAFVLAVAINTSLMADPLGPAFTYQGRLKQSGSPATGTYAMTFSLHDAQVGGVLLGSAISLPSVGISEGLFTVRLNESAEFGLNAFNGQRRWLEISVNGTPLAPRQELTGVPYAQALGGLRTETNVTSPNVIGGFSGNSATTGIVGGTIGGGGASGLANVVDGNYSTVSGGRSNVANGERSTIGGGGSNTAVASRSAVGGGELNTASGQVSTVSGGEANTASGGWSAVPGGSLNTAAGSLSLAAGHRAKANHAGTFVWADSAEADFASTSANQFLIRAAGGMGINTSTIQSSTSLEVLGKTNITANVGVIGALNVENTATVGEYGILAKTLSGGEARAIGGIGNSYGVYGQGATSFGVAGAVGTSIPFGLTQTSDLAPAGVFGISAANGHGVTGTTSGTGRAIVGYNLDNAGYAAHFTGRGLFSNLPGQTSSANDILHVQTSNSSGRAIYAHATSTSGSAAAIVAQNESPTGIGIAGTSNGGTAISGFTSGAGFTFGVSGTVSSNDGTGVFGRTTGAGGYGVAGIAANGSGDGVGVFGQSSSANGYAARFEGRSVFLLGRVGIGTATPGALLDVSGDGLFGGSVGVGTTTPGATLEVRTTAISGNAIRFGTAAGTGNLIAGASFVGLATGDGTTRLQLHQSTGNVGIGRQPSANKLEVEGNASKTAAGSWLANSDARIKTDIRTISSAVETLDKVRLVDFRYADDYRAQHPTIEDRRYVNVIAQEFAEVFPDSVKSSGEKLTNADPGSPGDEILQVDTYPLTIYSAAAIQELYRMIKHKESEIAALKSENVDFKERLLRIEAQLQLKASVEGKAVR